ncbi:ABC transporter ATP-binding protein [Streptomyces zaomyceticus]|uniref:ABC transporter ATP-binding protein n=1 Tax=Streptomyces zaomyceticus TaxID=68286 RepID=UPI0036927BF6
MSRSLSLREVSKSYGRDSCAVDSLSLDVEAGEFVVLLGPSGCGKSTVLRMVAGLEKMSSGSLHLDGERADHLAPGARDMAMIFQNFALYPHLTSGENIAFPLRFGEHLLGDHPRDDVDRRVVDLARLLGIEHLLERRPGQLSGGERQRVAMGRALSRRPSIFLMDEPLSNLDATLRNRLRAEIARITRDLGVTTLYVTHDQTEAMSLGDRIAVLRGGMLQQVGIPRDVYHLPANIFVAAFIGTPRINLLQATVHAPLGGGVRIELGEQSIELPEPLSADHQMLRIQQGRELTIGLRADALQLASAGTVPAGGSVLRGVVERVEYQGHESYAHVSTGSLPACLPDLEGRRPSRSGHRGTRTNGLRELTRRAVSRVTERLAAEESRPGGPDIEDRARPMPGLRADLLTRVGSTARIAPGTRVSVIVDPRQLYVFDHTGRRICPAPQEAPLLES